MGDPRWRRVWRFNTAPAEAFFRAREPLCVAACSRFLRLDFAQDQLWSFSASRGESRAILLHSKRTLFPLFDGNRDLPPPRFMGRFLRAIALHALQGLREDVEILETMVEEHGYPAVDRFDYDLMSLDREPSRSSLLSGPPSLVLRQPAGEDVEGLYPLQAAYEEEEVLPRGKAFNAPASRLSLERSVSRGSILAAELEGRIVGKIQVNAESFSRIQLGGVYVHPDYRGLGIATRMTAVFALKHLTRGSGVTLFVKKRNLPAQKLYRQVGFTPQEDYRIVYY